MIRLDLGCGKRKKEGYIGIDSDDYTNLYQKGMFIHRNITEKLPFEDNSVDEIYSSQTLNYLSSEDFIKIMWEIHRVLKPNGKVEIIVHHFSSTCSHYFIYKIFLTLNSFMPKNKTEKLDMGYPLPHFNIIKRKLLFDKRLIYFWNYPVELLTNLHLYTQIIWENTFLRSLFPATFIRFILRKNI